MDGLAAAACYNLNVGNTVACRIASAALRDVITRYRSRVTISSVEDEERLHRYTGRECRQQHGRHMAREKQSVADGTRTNVTQYVSLSYTFSVHARAMPSWNLYVYSANRSCITASAPEDRLRD